MSRLGMSRVNVWLCIYICTSTVITAEVFSSTAQLGQVLKLESALADILREYRESIEDHLKDVNRLLETTQRAEDTLSNDSLGYVGHPTNALQLVRRFSQDWQKLFQETDISFKNFSENRLPSGSYQHLAVRPGDYTGSLVSILRLQNTYNLTTRDLINGNVLGRMGEPLSRQDIIEIAKLAGKLHYAGPEVAAAWLNELLNETSEASLNHEDVILQLSDVYKQSGDLDQAIKLVDDLLKRDPENVSLNLKFWTLRQEQTKLQPPTSQQWLVEKDSQQVASDLWNTYTALCRGETLRSVKTLSSLYCRYRRTRVPYRPVKEEIMNFDPWVALFHDVISDDEAERMKSQATAGLPEYRASVGDPAKFQTSQGRISKVSWLWDMDENPLIGKLSKRVEELTGLDTTYSPLLSRAEPFQVVNYGMGGQYEPHHDFYEDTHFLANLPAHLLNTGDRIVTFMFYLSNITAGGATVFPRINVRVPAIKNAAAFWYNFKKSGDMDLRTEHAGCPVLLGQKWVANKWIRERGQEFRRPCGLTQDENDS